MAPSPRPDRIGAVVVMYIVFFYMAAVFVCCLSPLAPFSSWSWRLGRICVPVRRFLALLRMHEPRLKSRLGCACVVRARWRRSRMRAVSMGWRRTQPRFAVCTMTSSWAADSNSCQIQLFLGMLFMLQQLIPRAHILAVQGRSYAALPAYGFFLTAKPSVSYMLS